MKPLAIKKLYYSISEVSKIADLKPYVLRYWETEFPELRPAKNRAGNRIYRGEDIKLVLLIKKLLYTEKYTIEGARQKLRTFKARGDLQLRLSLNGNRKDSGKENEALSEIRKGLQEILALLNRDKDEDKDRGVAQSG